jgi:hypothetical protein
MYAVSRKRTGKHVAAEMRFLDTNHRSVVNKRFHGGPYLETNSDTKVFRVNELSTKVSVYTKKQQTFSMDTAILYKQPFR